MAHPQGAAAPWTPRIFFFRFTAVFAVRSYGRKRSETAPLTIHNYADPDPMLIRSDLFDSDKINVNFHFDFNSDFNLDLVQLPLQVT